jgi:hypothetical protein
MNDFFVKAVQKDKALLFGPLSPSITATKKDEKWEEIRLAMVAKGDKLLSNKNANYVKTIFWQNVRRGTMERVDSLKVSTGAEPKDEDLSAVSILKLQILTQFFRSTKSFWTLLAMMSLKV